jgi:hypothetical protein
MSTRNWQKRGGKVRTARFLHDWQRFPVAPITEGWLGSDDPTKPPRLPHASLSTLIALYAQLFASNLKYDSTMQAGAFEIDKAALVKATHRTSDRIEKTLGLLHKRGFLRSSKQSAAMLDPVSGRWPPVPFAMLPVRYVVSRLAAVKKAAETHGVKLGEALALYLVLVVQRNRAKEEIWFSREKSAAMAGLTSAKAMKCLSALLRAELVVRSGLSAYKFTLLGFEASE